MSHVTTCRQSLGARPRLRLPGTRRRRGEDAHDAVTADGDVRVALGSKQAGNGTSRGSEGRSGDRKHTPGPLHDPP